MIFAFSAEKPDKTPRQTINPAKPKVFLIQIIIALHSCLLEITLISIDPISLKVKQIQNHHYFTISYKTLNVFKATYSYLDGLIPQRYRAHDKKNLSGHRKFAFVTYFLIMLINPSIYFFKAGLKNFGLGVIFREIILNPIVIYGLGLCVGLVGYFVGVILRRESETTNKLFYGCTILGVAYFLYKHYNSFN